MNKKLKYFLITLLALTAWITADWFWPVKTSIREFDPVNVADYDARMWKSYYEKKPVRMFFQLAGVIRNQYHAPFWRSNIMAYYAGKAAFVFKKGSKREDYEKALPDLEKYYTEIRRLSKEKFDIKETAKMELEWWIVHRQRQQYSYSQLESVLQKHMAVMYTQPDSTFKQYAFYRTKAMQMRDEKEVQGVAKTDWESIKYNLEQSWVSLYKSVNK